MQGERVQRKKLTHLISPMASNKISQHSQNNSIRANSLPNISVQATNLSEESQHLLVKRGTILSPKNDILAAQAKQTFIQATRDQNMHRTMNHLRRLTTKPEEKPKFIHFQRIDQTRKTQFKSLVNSTTSNGQTFVKFAFRSYEKDDNHYINQFLNEVDDDSSHQITLGTMTVSDLWSNRQMQRLLKSTNFNTDKVMMQRLNKLMQQRRLVSDKKELVHQQAQFNNSIKTLQTKKDQSEMMGLVSSQLSPKRRYHKDRYTQSQHQAFEKDNKLHELIQIIDKVHESNLKLYQSLSGVIEGLRSKKKLK